MSSPFSKLCLAQAGWPREVTFPGLPLGSKAGAVPEGSGSSCFRPLSGLRRCLSPNHGP
jgi:hypothetical protein